MRLFLIAATAAAASLPTIPLDSLASPAGLTALRDVGAVAVSGVPGMEEATARGLGALVACEGRGGSGFDHNVIHDGSARRSLYAQGVGPAVPEELQRRCPSLESELSPLRDAASLVASRFIEQYAHHKGQAMNKLLAGGRVLEHLHVYYRDDDAPQVESDLALPFHVDQGAFLIMTPARFFDEATTAEVQAPSSGLLVGLDDGTIIEPSFDPSETILLMGDAMKQFVDPTIKPPAHALNLTQLVHGHTVRAWYGRMYLFNSEAKSLTGETTADDHFHAPLGRRLSEGSDPDKEAEKLEEMMANAPSSRRPAQEIRNAAMSQFAKAWGEAGLGELNVTKSSRQENSVTLRGQGMNVKQQASVPASLLDRQQRDCKIKDRCWMQAEVCVVDDKCPDGRRHCLLPDGSQGSCGPASMNWRCQWRCAPASLASQEQKTTVAVIKGYKSHTKDCFTDNIKGPLNVDSPEDCTTHCNQDPECKGFAYAAESKQCLLKHESCHSPLGKCSGFWCFYAKPNTEESPAAPVSAIDETAGGFCDSSVAVDMYMQGFVTMGDATRPCVILFIQPFVLDSPSKFAVGMLMVMLLGVVTQCVVGFRSSMAMEAMRKKRPELDVPSVAAFALTIFLGWLMMLVAMTYSVELFLAAVVGLTMGHVVSVRTMNVLFPASGLSCCGEEGNDVSLASIASPDKEA
eukprot:CAMPEP_0204297452 /NCGR_PEP_ID=MMETSP0468-20130131/73214_1 /ASSEMBLY_ACC=CAM_ASM_000383 /TAXON_ID=2969 /ORGANISM="Oxyrrhis marina" /LENGTH=687 /DNA_ID=CAMNT_0051276237 /DNA_START=47 /DNA_END=2110 /DNA_ORIENTATION=+